MKINRRRNTVLLFLHNGQLPWLVKFVEAAWKAFECSKDQYNAKGQHCTEHGEHNKSEVIITSCIITFHTVDNRQLDEGEEPC